MGYPWREQINRIDESTTAEEMAPDQVGAEGAAIEVPGTKHQDQLLDKNLHSGTHTFLLLLAANADTLGRLLRLGSRRY